MSNFRRYQLQGQLELYLRRSQRWANWGYSIYFVCLLGLLPFAFWSFIIGRTQLVGLSFALLTLLCAIGFIFILRAEWWQKGARMVSEDLNRSYTQ